MFTFQFCAEKKGPVTINEQEIEELVNVQHLKNDLQKGVDHLKNDYIKHLSLRSTSGNVIWLINSFTQKNLLRIFENE